MDHQVVRLRTLAKVLVDMQVRVLDLDRLGNDQSISEQFQIQPASKVPDSLYLRSAISKLADISHAHEASPDILRNDAAQT